MAAAFWFDFEPLRLIESGARDFVARNGEQSPTNPDLIFLAIDQPTVSVDHSSPEEIEASPALTAMQKSGWPWRRDIYPMIIERLVNAGVKLIVFDMLFPTEREGDEAFRAALERYGEKVIIGANFVDAASSTLTPPTPSLIPPRDSLDPRVAYVNFWPDPDKVVRHAHYRTTANEAALGLAPHPDEEVFYSLAGRTLLKIGRPDLVPAGRKYIRFAKAVPIVSLGPMFNEAIWELPPFRSGELFRDKIVVIGPEGDWAKDVIRTPFGELAGPALHILALNAALRNDFLREPSKRTNLLSILAAGMLAWLLSAFVAQPLVRFGIFIALGVAFFFAGLLVYSPGWGAVVLCLASPILAFGSSGIVWLTCEQVLDRIEKTRTRRTLERYVSKDLVKEILDNPANILSTLGGVRRSVAILFSDLRGFTTMTEEADSAQLVAQLNEYLTEMVKRIFDSKGTIDKFIGDAVMAVWGEVYSEGPAKDVERAVRAALEMQAALAELNVLWEKRGMRSFKMGIGINYGSVIVGNIGATGATEKMELTVIGDPVNLASRLEGLTKEYGIELILGEGAAELVGGVFHLQQVDLVQVKGKTKPINIHTVLGATRDPLPSDIRDYLAIYAEGLKRYRAGEFAQAIESFESALKSRPGDPLAAMYVERCNAFREHPPASGWGGVFVMTKK